MCRQFVERLQSADLRIRDDAHQLALHRAHSRVPQAARDRIEHTPGDFHDLIDRRASDSAHLLGYRPPKEPRRRQIREKLIVLAGVPSLLLMLIRMDTLIVELVLLDHPAPHVLGNVMPMRTRFVRRSGSWISSRDKTLCVASCASV